jgi:hypothetical protein
MKLNSEHWPSKEMAKKVLDYLTVHKMGFCYLGSGELVSVLDCREILSLDLSHEGCIMSDNDYMLP